MDRLGTTKRWGKVKQLMAPVGQIIASGWRRYANANSAIVLCCLAMLGTAWTLAIERVSFERGDTIAAAVKQNANLAIAFEEHTIRTLKGIDQAVLFVRNQYQEHGLKLNIREMIERGTLDASLFNYIGITDESGNVVLASREFKATNLADREYFRFHQQNDDKGMFIGKPNLGRISHKWAISMSHRINKADGSFGGMVYAAVDPEYFTRFYQRADLGEHGLATLIGLDGIVRARRAGQKSSFGQDMRGAKLFMEQANSRNGNFLTTGKADGTVRFVNFRTLTQYPLIVLVGTSEAETLASFHQRERDYYLISGLVSATILIFAAFMTVALSRRQRAEQTALEQFELAEAFFNHSVSCLVVLDRDFNFLRVNEAYARACRREIGEFAGCNHFDMYPSETKQIFEEVVRTKKPFETFERAFVFPDQPERGVTYWEWTLVPILDRQGEVEYLVFSLNEVTERKRAQESIEQSMLRVQALSERVMKIQREEREGIARELHDELGQTLTALKVNLQMLEPYCVGGEAEDHLTEALMITGRSLDQVRGMMLNLRPVGLEDLGLAVVLESHLARQAEVAGWDSQFEAKLPLRLRPELEMACFRVVQEALTNVMRHAHARQVWVALGVNAGEVQLSVRDDGQGFDVALASKVSPTGGFGLIGMQERVRQLGGRLAIDSAPGRGTEVRASFPCGPAGGRRESDADARTQA